MEFIGRSFLSMAILRHVELGSSRRLQTDGAGLIFTQRAGHKNGQFHYKTMWAPLKGSPHRALAAILAALAGRSLRRPPDDVGLQRPVKPWVMIFHVF